jgi:hypothetical protein
MNNQCNWPDFKCSIHKGPNLILLIWLRASRSANQETTPDGESPQRQGVHRRAQVNLQRHLKVDTEHLLLIVEVQDFLQ